MRAVCRLNLGAGISPLVCGYLGENINWHYGFAAAGVAMTLGVIQYVFSAKFLGRVGVDPSQHVLLSDHWIRIHREVPRLTGRAETAGTESPPRIPRDPLR